MLERMEPFLLGGHMIRKVQADETTWGDLPHKFEAGTAPMAEAVGLGAAVDYLTGVGFDAIEQHEHDLTAYALGALQEVPGIRLFGPPPDRRAGIVSFAFDDVHPHDVAQVLDWEGVAVRAGHHCCQPLMARLGVAATNAGELLSLHHPRGDRPPRPWPLPGEKGLWLAVDQLYRENILDHYKNPRNYGAIEDADAEAEGMNPLCGDEVTITVAFADDGDTIEDVKFSGRGCAISQAATSMLTELVKGRSASEVATLPREDLLDEVGVPLTPVRLKCAILGLSTLRLALHKEKGTPLPEEWASDDELELK